MTTKNFTRHLRHSKHKTIQIAILEEVYTVPLDPPAILGINLSLIEANPQMPDSEAAALLRDAIDTVFGAGAFDQWIRWMGMSDVLNIAYYVRYGCDDALFDQLESASADPNAPNLPEA
jgi:hypothetical protein